MNQDNKAVQSDSTKRKLEIYVAGLPPHVDQLMLQSYFGQFGQISRIYIYNQKSSVWNSSLDTNSKLHCKLLMADEQGFDSVLEKKDHKLMGRSLFCLEFKKGRKLIKQSKSIMSRRAVVKRVPAYFTESTLRRLLENEIGQVEAIYEFKAENESSQAILWNKKHKSFSVTFSSSEVAEYLSQPRSLHLGHTDPILIEKFDPQSSKDQRKEKIQGQLEGPYQGLPPKVFEDKLHKPPKAKPYDLQFTPYQTNPTTVSVSDRDQKWSKVTSLGILKNNPKVESSQKHIFISRAHEWRYIEDEPINNLSNLRNKHPVQISPNDKPNKFTKSKVKDSKRLSNALSIITSSINRYPQQVVNNLRFNIQIHHEIGSNLDHEN